MPFADSNSPSVGVAVDDVPPAVKNHDAWPDRSVLLGSDGKLNVVAATPSTWVPIVHVDAEQLGPLPRLEDLDLPPLDSAHDIEHEEMPVKARKRGRVDTSSDSDPEDPKRSLVVESDGALSDYESASEPDDVIPDTTVDVHINPDATLPTAVIPPTQLVEDAPVVSPRSSSIVEGLGAVKVTPPQARTQALSPDSSDHIEEFTPTPPRVRRIVSEEPLHDSDDIESPFSSGDSAAAACAQQHTESPDVVSPSPHIVINTVFPFPAIDRQASAVDLTGLDGGLSIDLTRVDDALDVMWEDDGCSSHKSSSSSGTASSKALSPTDRSEPGLAEASPGSDDLSLPDEGVLRQAIEALLTKHLESAEAPSE